VGPALLKAGIRAMIRRLRRHGRRGV